MTRRSLGLLTLLALILVFPSLALAYDDAAIQAAWDAATKSAKVGPVEVSFTDQASLAVPAKMAFIPVAESATLMKLWGNSVDSRFRGLLVPTSDNERWIITIDQVADGYVKDEDAKTWNTDDLLQSLKDGTEAQNAQRVKMGIPALDVVGWVEKPAYDIAHHRLVWSLKAVERGAPAGAEATVNYNTYALGRDGYFEINLLTGSDRVESEKPIAQTVLAAFRYNDGKRYEDFKAGTDHLAEYGIAALIGGVVAKKLGLLALVGVFFAKFAKVILIAVAVAGGAIAKFFRRGGKTST
jgi:uncharacterized membrane-anchored protein